MHDVTGSVGFQLGQQPGFLGVEATPAGLDITQSCTQIEHVYDPNSCLRQPTSVRAERRRFSYSL